MRTKLSFLLIMLIVLSSCTDLDGIYNRLNEHESRLKKLEAVTAKANETIEVLQSLIDAQAGKVGIVSFVPLQDGSGYILNMSDGATITLKSGENGVTPNIGVATDVDGLLYWTINGQFMLDAHGRKIKAEGRDGVSPVTPKMRVNANGFWEISSDGGKTWSGITDDKGKPVSAVGNGTGNLDITEDDDFITIKFNGKTFVIPKNGQTPPTPPTPPATKSIEISDVTKASSISLTFTPSDNSMTYFWSALKKSDYDQKMTNPDYTSIFDFDKAWFGMYDPNEWFDRMKPFLLTGVQTRDAIEEVKIVVDDTEYMCWAYGLDDKGNLVTDVTLKSVKTPKSVPTGNTFTVNVNQVFPNGVDANIIPSVKNDTYYVSLQKARYVQWWLDNDGTRAMAYSLLKDLITGEGKIEDFTFSGDAHITPDKLSAGSSNTDYYIIIFSYSPENGVGSDIHLHPFKTAKNS